jgi:hypothetical protein
MIGIAYLHKGGPELEADPGENFREEKKLSENENWRNGRTKRLNLVVEKVWKMLIKWR